MATKSGKETGAALSGNKKSSTRKSRREDFDKKISNAKDKRTQTFYEVYNVLKKDAGAALPNKVMGEGFDKLVAKKLGKETGAALNDNEKSAIKKLTGFDNKNDFIKYKYGMNQGGSVKMKAKGYSAGGAPKSRAQRRATLSRAQRSMLDGVQGREGSKQSTSVIQDLSDQYGYKPGKRAGAKGGMGKGKRAKPPGMQMGGAAMKTKGYAKGGAAMKTKSAAKGGARKPSSSKSGLYGRR